MLNSTGGHFEVLGLHISHHPPPNSNFPLVDIFKSRREHLILKIAKKLIIKLLWYVRLYRQKSPIYFIHGVGTLSNEEKSKFLYTFRKFRPDIVHTLGLFPASSMLEKYSKEARIIGDFSWIVQARGGPDLDLNMKNKDFVIEIKKILSSCNFFIADNKKNYSNAIELGINEEKIFGCEIFPGAGGVDYSLAKYIEPPSRKGRVILWPKAYNCIQSDGLAVVEGLRLAKLQLGEFTLISTAVTQDVGYWIREMLQGDGITIEIYDRIPKFKIHEFLSKSRIMLAPSLSEGIPNIMYESMAMKAVPILSALDTYKSLFIDGENVLYASNLDPRAIADALIKAMNDDLLADSIAKKNLELLPKMAGYAEVKDRVIDLYMRVITIGLKK